MFAPKSAKAESTQGRGPGSRSAFLPPAHRSSTQSSSAHQGSTSDLGLEEAASLDFAHDHQAAPRASWNLAKIGLSPHARDGQLQTIPSLRGPRLPARIQTKLMVNEPGDEFEQEADRVADSIMQAPRSSTERPADKIPVPARSVGPQLSVKPDNRHSNQASHSTGLQPPVRAISAAPIDFGMPPIIRRVLNSPGRPLDSGIRNYLEPRFQADFSQVRVHDGYEAAESTSSVRASAYTVGNHIVFGKGRYAPGTGAGDRLLAHELTHTVQQAGVMSSGHKLAPAKAAEGSVIQRNPDDQPQASPGTATPDPKAVTPDPSQATSDLKNANEDSDPSGMPPIRVHGKPRSVSVEGRCDSLHLHGKTDGNFDGGTGTVQNQTVTPGRGCNCAEGQQCAHVKGTLVIDYSVSVTITMPPMPSGLNACEQGKVQDFLTNVLQPHEDEHERRMKTYNGQTKHPIDVTGCSQDDVTKKVQAIQDAEEPARHAAAQKLSDAIDPFVRTIDCSDCDKQSAAPKAQQGDGGQTQAAPMAMPSSAQQSQPATPSIQRQVADVPEAQPASVKKRQAETDWIKDPAASGSHDPKSFAALPSKEEQVADLAKAAQVDKIFVGPAAVSKPDSVNTVTDKDMHHYMPGMNYSQFVADLGETFYVDAAGGPMINQLSPARTGPLPKVAIVVGGIHFPDKQSMLATLRHEMMHAEHLVMTLKTLEKWRAAKTTDSFDDWLSEQNKKGTVTTLDKVIATEEETKNRPNTELLGYTEGFMTALLLADPPPTKNDDPIFRELFGMFMSSSEPWANADPATRSEALGRLQQYFCQVLDPPRQAAFKNWVATPPKSQPLSLRSWNWAPIRQMHDHFFKGLQKIVDAKCPASGGSKPAHSGK